MPAESGRLEASRDERPSARGPGLAALRRALATTNGAPPIALAIRTADGEVVRFGDGAPSFEIRVVDERGWAALRSLRELEICEAYVRGELDLEGDLIRALELRGAMTDRKPWIRLWARLQPLLFGRRRCNPSWIARHYDSGNVQLVAAEKDFDTYTPGIYEPGDTLEAGAVRKLENAFQALRLGPGARLLDVGCGWGGFLRYAAKRGVRATGITLSRHQLEHARKRLSEDGLEATVLYEDFFSYAPPAPLDAISMMGVLEDLSDYGAVMRRIASWLRPGGRVYCDFATSEDRFDTSSFITRHVWPGLFRMVHLPELVTAIGAARFEIVEMQNDRHDYFVWAKLGYERWMERKARVLEVSGEATWRLMRLLFAGAAHVMSTPRTGTSAYRLVLESRPDPGWRDAAWAEAPATARGAASPPSASRP